MGFNGMPMGVPDTEAMLEDRETKLRWTIHAEVNAIILARKDLMGSTLYATLFPCSGCAKVLIQAGIERVVAPPTVPERWAEDCLQALRMFAVAGVDVAYYVGEGDETEGGEGPEEARRDLRGESRLPWDS